MSDEKKERKVKALAPFVVGNWSNGGADDNGVPVIKFFAKEKQPDQPITDLAGIVAWTKANYGDQPGRYEFVRKQPGMLTIASQTVTKAAFA
jgi:hypothetical protein